jgi:hypothetical protein
MARVGSSARAAGRPQFSPKLTGGADLVTVTITGVEMRKSQFRDVEQPVLSFKEFADTELRVGKRGTDRLCEKFGDETDDWIGETIPLVKAREDVGSNSYIVYQVPPVEEWAELLKRAKKARR